MGDLFGSDPPKAYESMADVLRAIKMHFGPAISEVNKYIGPTAKAQLEADTAVSPGYAELEKNLYEKYGPILNKIGSDIAAENALRASEAELAVSRGPGKELVNEALISQKYLDPEYYANREALGKAINTYLSAIDPTRLTEAEREEVARGLGRMGFTNPSSAADTVAKAMTFGSALQQKQNSFGDAIAKVAASIPAMRSGLQGFEIATRRPLMGNTGEARLSGPTQGAGGQNTFGFANNFLNQASGLESSYLAGRAPWYKQLSGVMGGLGDVGSVVGKLFGGFK